MLDVSNISAGYGDRAVVRGLSFKVAAGECVLLRGANGCGKTTLLKTIAGLQKPLGGTVRTGRTVLVPTRIPKVKGFTVREFVATATWKRAVSCHEEDAITEALESMGIAGKGDSDIASLSDGEFQKACIATALVQDADVILLDEPTAFLDVESKIAVMELLRDISRREKAVLFSSHDVYDAERICDRTIRL